MGAVVTAGISGGGGGDGGGSGVVNDVTVVGDVLLLGFE